MVHRGSSDTAGPQALPQVSNGALGDAVTSASPPAEACAKMAYQQVDFELGSTLTVERVGANGNPAVDLTYFFSVETEEELLLDAEDDEPESLPDVLFDSRLDSVFESLLLSDFESLLLSDFESLLPVSFFPPPGAFDDAPLFW